MKFIDLGLSKPLLKAIEKQNYIETTDIQEIAIPEILENKDIIGIAQTGTGKTAAFALPILEKLIRKNNPDKKIKVLILSPTRELALQIRDSIRDFAIDTNFKCSVILGGVNQSSQVEVLKKGVDILVVTPGRFVELVKSKHADISNVEMLVLDEADTMLDMGFIKDVKFLISKTPKTRQTMLFSATMPKEIEELTTEFLNNPVILKTTPVSSTAPKIKQLIYFVDKKNKVHLLLDLLKKEDIKSALIFTRTKHGANKLEDHFKEVNIDCSVIHGNKSQVKRVKALTDFKSGATKIMIATDIAARGIDINELSHVINYDMPDQNETYVHRIGRTARAGLEGTSISLCDIDEKENLKEIEKLIKQTIEIVHDHDYPMQNFVLSEKKPTGRNNFSKNSTRRPIPNKANSDRKTTDKSGNDKYNKNKPSFEKNNKSTFGKTSFGGYNKNNSFNRTNGSNRNTRQSRTKAK